MVSIEFDPTVKAVAVTAERPVFCAGCDPPAAQQQMSENRRRRFLTPQTGSGHSIHQRECPVSARKPLTASGASRTHAYAIFGVRYHSRKPPSCAVVPSRTRNSATSCSRGSCGRSSRRELTADTISDRMHINEAATCDRRQVRGEFSRKLHQPFSIGRGATEHASIPIVSYFFSLAFLRHIAVPGQGRYQSSQSRV